MIIKSKHPEGPSTWARIDYAGGWTAVIEHDRPDYMGFKGGGRIGFYLHTESIELVRESTGGWRIERPFKHADLGPFPSRRAAIAALRVLE